MRNAFRRRSGNREHHPEGRRWTGTLVQSRTPTAPRAGGDEPWEEAGWNRTSTRGVRTERSGRSATRLFSICYRAPQWPCTVSCTICDWIEPDEPSRMWTCGQIAAIERRDGVFRGMPPPARCGRGNIPLRSDPQTDRHGHTTHGGRAARQPDRRRTPTQPVRSLLLESRPRERRLPEPPAAGSGNSSLTTAGRWQRQHSMTRT